ncbi:MAG: hypothetical protein NTW16_05935 [Bacteroidetes bacterium]|nr:hypothetical protein [Bacteroidota bacterium]
MKNLMIKFSTMLALAVVFAIAFSVSSCSKDDDPVTPPVVVLDGYYVVGAGTAYSAVNDKAMMKSTYNEILNGDAGVTPASAKRTELLELYIPVKAGADGFSIVQIAGSVTKTYGPGADFATDATPGTDEPKDVFFKKGSYAENTTKFTVTEDGLYHVVLDYGLNKVVVTKVNWQIIGSATALGWTSTPLTQSAFNTTTMSWELANVTLTGNQYKFRYSFGWKIIIDTTLDLGGSKKGVNVNTNLGFSKDTLLPGGGNINNKVPGIYTVNLSYTVGSGYKATLTKTGDLPMTNWTGVKCDAVGTGISSDNTNAIPDPSAWNWGNKLLADGGGIPTKTGNIYTWTWTVIFEADQGFKVRSENGVAPPSGGANFDVGFAALNTTASAAEIVDGGGGNLKCTTKGTYTMKLNIDASNADKMEIVVTK